jgi:hypothetical protein
MDARAAAAIIDGREAAIFGGGAFGLTFEGVGGREADMNERSSGKVAARLFKPRDRLISARLQQMCGPDQ